jgi:tRNA-2-methylthio-N6-dimethylallyladenosine synthase
MSSRNHVRYDMACMFFYLRSVPETLAARKLADDIPLETKKLPAEIPSTQ